jgi:hypothetical protein
MSLRRRDVSVPNVVSTRSRAGAQQSAKTHSTQIFQDQQGRRARLILLHVPTPPRHYSFFFTIESLRQSLRLCGDRVELMNYEKKKAPGTFAFSLLCRLGIANEPQLSLQFKKNYENRVRTLVWPY